MTQPPLHGERPFSTARRRLSPRARRPEASSGGAERRRRIADDDVDLRLVSPANRPAEEIVGRPRGEIDDARTGLLLDPARRTSVDHLDDRALARGDVRHLETFPAPKAVGVRRVPVDVALAIGPAQPGTIAGGLELREALRDAVVAGIRVTRATRVDPTTEVRRVVVPARERRGARAAIARPRTALRLRLRRGWRRRRWRRTR